MNAAQSPERPVSRRNLLVTSALAATGTAAVLSAGTAHAAAPTVPPDVAQGISKGKRYRLRELGTATAR